MHEKFGQVLKEIRNSKKLLSKGLLPYILQRTRLWLIRISARPRTEMKLRTERWGFMGQANPSRGKHSSMPHITLKIQLKLT